MGKRRSQQLSDRPSTKPLLSINDETEAKVALILEMQRYIKAKLLNAKDHGKTKTEMDNVLRLPKGLLENIDDTCRWKPGSFTAKHNKKIAFMQVWKSTLKESFASLSSEAMTTASTLQASYSSAASPLQNKLGVFSAIFDMDEVTKACTKNGTEFICRMDVTPAFDTLLFGKTVKPRQQSMYEKRLMATSSDFDTTSMPTNSIHDHDLDTIGKAISLAEKERDRLTKAKRDTTKQLGSTRRAMKKSTIVNHPSTTNTSKGKGKAETAKFAMVKEERQLKVAVQKATRDVHAAQDTLADLRQTQYQLQKVADAKKSKKTKPLPPIPPTKISKTTRVEEDPRHTLLDLNLKECHISGTDSGIVTLATTVTHNFEELEKLKAGQFFKLPKAKKLVAKDIAWKTGQIQLQQRLQRTKYTTPDSRKPDLLHPQT
ncbi:hypothetical protein DM01DRAFT_1375534 [Hesseltinella vesiculosa]|uniref:Uncharacterized protein n=1 Tax=Hesseltinella vesiculosa TaxID=101127 RepID=A0A1X2GDI3_9FUNG|nr:hypothetical protein DM01DRAFT_1375534 [Hesseltinella vesiculosa]